MGTVKEAPAILVLGYRRPKQIRELLLQLKDISKKKIYVSLDSAPHNNQKLSREVHETHEAVKALKEKLDLEVRFAASHMGCYKGVKSAIDWFFDRETIGLILEDDLKVSEQIIQVSSELIEIAKEDPSIGSISLYRANGYDLNAPPEKMLSYSQYPTSWGWITWRNKWQKIISDVPSGLSAIKLRSVFLSHGGLIGYRRWDRVAKNLESGELDSWAYRWLFTHWLLNWNTLVSPINLIENCGFDGNATHTKQGISRSITSGSLEKLQEWKISRIGEDVEAALLKEIYGIPMFQEYMREKLIPNG